MVEERRQMRDGQGGRDGPDGWDGRVDEDQAWRPDAAGPGPATGLQHGAPVFAVAPVRQRTRVPRAAVAGIAVAVVAFVAGIGVASTAPSPPPAPLVPATERPADVDASAIPATGPGVARPATPDALDPGFGAPVATPVRPGTARLPAPGSSAFIAGFDPPALIATVDGAERCRAGAPRDKEVPRTRRDGPRITFQRSWVAWCPVPAASRQAFLLGVFRAMVDAVPAATFGYSASLAGAGDALFPYGQPPLAGTVAITADDAGRGVAIAIVVSEWRVDAAP